MMNDATTISNNRCNIPAICRIPGRGTAFLVAPGLLMTSVEVVRSKPEAAKLKAVFFESGKQAPVAVDLKPYKTFFVSAFPEHLSYALVACDTRGIRSVIPVKLPLVEAEWPDIAEGDVCLSVQHPLPNTAGDPEATPELGEDEEEEVSALGTVGVDGQPVEVKQFEEVLSTRDNVITFKTNHRFNFAGCPLFNAQGMLAGLHTQLVRPEQDMSVLSYAVHIKDIVRHLFANAKLGLIETTNTPQQLWRTWHTERDVSRTLRIVQNFQETEIVRTVLHELCRFGGDDEKMKEIVAHGGVAIVIDTLHRYRMDAEVVKCALKTLWDLSFGDDSRRKEIVVNGGIPIVLTCMERYRDHEEITEYSCVLLYNLSSQPEHVNGPLCERGIAIVTKAPEMFPKSEVVLKFAMGVLMHIASSATDDQYIEQIVGLGGIEMACRALATCSHNEYLAENCVLLLAAVASHVKFVGHPAMAEAVVPLINVVRMYATNKTTARRGNQALWHLGLQPSLRVVIARNGGLQVLDDTMDAVAQTLER